MESLIKYSADEDIDKASRFLIVVFQIKLKCHLSKQLTGIIERQQAARSSLSPVPCMYCI